MSLLIADAGPLFSLAAGDLLWVLERFSFAVTDVVKEESFDKGRLSSCSPEAERLLAFYNEHAPDIRVIPTQVGAQLAALRKLNARYTPPRNLGELSIQSYLIALRLEQPDANPVVLFEDGWFTRNAASLPLGTLMSTQAFLLNLQKLRIISSAEAARAAIALARPNASLLVYESDLRTEILRAPKPAQTASPSAQTPEARPPAPARQKSGRPRR